MGQGTEGRERRGTEKVLFTAGREGHGRARARPAGRNSYHLAGHDKMTAFFNS